MISDVRVNKTGQMAGSPIGLNAKPACWCSCTCTCPIERVYSLVDPAWESNGWGVYDVPQSQIK